jgi:uncharacterized protein
VSAPESFSSSTCELISGAPTSWFSLSTIVSDFQNSANARIGVVLAELGYLIATRGGQAEELKLLGDVARGGYELAQFNADDVAAAMAIISRYGDYQIRLADASLAVLARHYRCTDVLTLDQRPFRVIGGFDDAPFRLLPFDDVLAE